MNNEKKFRIDRLMKLKTTEKRYYCQMLNEYLNNHMNRIIYIEKEAICNIYYTFIERNFKYYTE